MAWFARNKSSIIKLVDLFHIWCWPLTLPLIMAKNFQGQILKLPYLQNVWHYRKKIKEGELFGWIVLYFVNNIWLAFCFHRMVQCRLSVTLLSFAISVWSCHYSNCDGVYFGHNTCWCTVLGFTPYTHHHVWNFTKLYVIWTQIWYRLWSNLLHLFNNIWNADRVMGYWTDGDFTVWPWQEWNIVDKYSIESAFNIA